MKVRNLMSTELFYLKPDQQLDLAGDVMRWHHIRHVPVVDDELMLVGILTHRDLLKASVSALAGISSNQQRNLAAHIPVNEIMRKEVTTTTPDTDLREAASVMLDEKLGCLPVVEDGKLVGIITEADYLTLAWEVTNAGLHQKDFTEVRKYSKHN